ncbi:MAG: PTS sugar transporter subunit IIC [Agathobacter sp.]|nr:PTS sugar transporter subunit IIC [Lachnospiraceae bacterium]MBR3812117.1 PTS sugar transporter subunit IIC [Agathobacter sp.]
MNRIKKLIDEIFIEGLSGMATGLFATLIIGTIIQQVGTLVPGTTGNLLYVIGKMAASITGVGIGCGVAVRFKESPLVVMSAATCGMVGAFASKIMAGSVLVDGNVLYAGPGEPLGAYVAALAGVYVGRLISGKTKVDILITPLLSILAGSMVGFLIGPPISRFMNFIGELINVSTQQQPFIMGMLVSVIMGMTLTLPISSAALGIILNLSGLAAGAATVGCCANMVGFAVASYRENKVNGLLAQGLGTSMLQIANIVKKPIIWLPAILTSAILGPLSTLVFHMTNNATGSGMGTAGLVGQITTFQTMTAEGGEPALVFVKILIIQIILPAILSLSISNFMRKKGWIRTGDMRLNV